MPWESGELNWAWPWLLSHAAVGGLVLARVLGLCLTAPGLAIPELDWRFRIGLAAALGMVLVPVVEPLIVAPAGWQSVASASFLELLAGAVLGYLAGDDRGRCPLRRRAGRRPGRAVDVDSARPGDGR